MRCVINGSLCEKKNSKSYPVKIYATVAPLIEAISNGITEAAVKSSISTSTVNNIPAIGALKMPAIPAAAPHPTRIINNRGDRRKKLPKLLPIDAPVYTIGPSAPTEPPKPIVIELATTEEYILWGFSRLFFCEIAYNTLVTPCEILYFTTYRT